MKKGILAVLFMTMASLAISQFAQAASSNYYAKSTVWFNVPSDATFSIAMPSDYTSLTAITGTTEGGATAVNLISFNFSATPQAALQVPYQAGASANAQATNLKPIYYVLNTGNTAEKIESYLSAQPSAGIAIYVNVTCSGTCTSPQTALIAANTTTGSPNTLTTSLGSNEHLNITYYANTTSAIASGQTSLTLYIKSTAV